MSKVILNQNKIEDICWNLWFVVDALDSYFTRKIAPEDSKIKDNSKSCLFSYMEELEEIQTTLQNLKVCYNG